MWPDLLEEEVARDLQGDVGHVQDRQGNAVGSVGQTQRLLQPFEPRVSYVGAIQKSASLVNPRSSRTGDGEAAPDLREEVDQDHHRDGE